MKLFDIVPSELFSVLASKNRILYADALDVLYGAYDGLKIPEDSYFIALCNRMENEIAEANFDDEDIEEEELANVTGRARFIIRKLCSKGWFEKEINKDFKEDLIIPNYSSKIIETLHQLRNTDPMRGFSFVYDTFSALSMANSSDDLYAKMVAIYGAYEKTENLKKMLRDVYHGVKGFFQRQLKMQDVNKILESHFDDFESQIMETYIKPLKIKDSLPKYRVPIENILDDWISDENVLESVANEALKDRRGHSLIECENDILRKVQKIKDTYEVIESEYLSEIDEQVRRYTRATTQKIENLTNRNQNLSGNINYILGELAKNRKNEEMIAEITSCFHLYDQTYIDENSLYKKRKPFKRSEAEPIEIDENDIKVDGKSIGALFNSQYGKKALQEYMQEFFGSEDIKFSDSFEINSEKDYIMSILAVIESGSKSSFYGVEPSEGNTEKGRYTMPNLCFVRKKGK